MPDQRLAERPRGAGNLVAAGEASGALPQILLRVVKHLMQAKELRDRVQQELIYPAFLALAGAVLITIFITFMVPQLSGFMAQSGLSPAGTPQPIQAEIQPYLTLWPRPNVLCSTRCVAAQFQSRYPFDRSKG